MIRSERAWYETQSRFRTGLLSFADFWFPKAQKRKHSVLELPCFKTSGLLLQSATISVDLLFCNANSNENQFATGYHFSSPLRGAIVGNCSSYRPAGCQMPLDVVTLVPMTFCSEDDFVQLGLSLLSMTVCNHCFTILLQYLTCPHSELLLKVVP